MKDRQWHIKNIIGGDFNIALYSTEKCGEALLDTPFGNAWNILLPNGTYWTSLQKNGTILGPNTVSTLSTLWLIWTIFLFILIGCSKE